MNTRERERELIADTFVKYSLHEFNGVKKLESKNLFNFSQKILFVCLLVFIFGFSFCAKASAATYYVDSSITDTNVASATPDCTNYNTTTYACSGGSASAFATIADINAFFALQPGDNVYFRKGQTWREQLTVPASGTAGNVITFGAFGSGEKPIISGGLILTSATYKWTQSASGINEYYVTLSNDGNPTLTEVKTAIMNDTLLVNGTIGSLTDHQWDWGDNDTLGFSTFYIRDETGDPDISGVVIDVAQRDAACEMLANDYITIENIVFQLGNNDVWTTSNSIGITINDCEFYFAAGSSTANVFTSHNNSTITINNSKFAHGISDSALVAHGGTQTDMVIVVNDSEIWDGGNAYACGGIGIHTINRTYMHNFAGIALRPSTGIFTINYSIIENVGTYGWYGATGTTNINNCLFYECSSRSLYAASGATLNVYNTITYNSGSVMAAQINTGSTYAGNNNLFFRTTAGTVIKYLGTDYTLANFANYKTAASPRDSASLAVDPLFTSTVTPDFTLLSTSPAIDAGIDVSLTTDYAGNSIYGTPDIGAYEYQPPYTMGTDEPDTSADVRIYGDGKFRNTQTAGGTTADLSIVPASGDITQWLDVDIATWNAFGDYSKEWTETSATITGNTAHTVGDLKASTYYTVKVDSSRYGTYLSNSSGQITFTYTGGYSTKTFEVDEDTAGSVAFSLTSPVNNSSTSNSKPTLSWNASSDTESGLAYYQLYIDSGLDTNNISGTSVVPITGLSCGIHTWYVKAIDNAGNSTNSNTFNLTMACGGGAPGSAAPIKMPEPKLQTINADGSITYLGGEEQEQNEIRELQEKIQQLQKLLIQLLQELARELTRRIEMLQ